MATRRPRRDPAVILARTEGTEYIAKLLTSLSTSNLYDRGVDAEWFTEEERGIFEYVLEFQHRHGTYPAIRTVEREFRTDLPTDLPEVEGFYADRLESRMVRNALRNTLADVQDIIVSGRDPREALDLVRATVQQLTLRTMGREIQTLQALAPQFLADYEMRDRLPDLIGIPTGWRTFDEVTGGLQGGDMLAIVGRIARGKSTVLVKLACEALASGRRVLFVSFEMPLLQMARRMFATMLRLPYTNMKFARLSHWGAERMRVGVREIAETTGSRLHLMMAGFDSTVSQVYGLARELHPDIIILDGGGMLQPSKNARDRTGRSRHEQLSAATQEVRLMGLSLNIPTATSYHFNREVSANARRGTLEKIGLTDEIGKISTIVAGVFRPEDTEDNDDSEIVRNIGEEGKEMWIEIIKGRDGERAKFKIHFDYDRMDFSEIDDLASLTAIITEGA